MEDIQKKLEEYNNKILAGLVNLHVRLPDELKPFLMVVVSLIGERDELFNAYVKKAMASVFHHAEDIQTFMNYMQFDLEATRRERDKYFKQLKEGDADA